MTTLQLSGPNLPLSPDLGWDPRVMWVCVAAFCLLLAIDLTASMVRALVRALHSLALGAFAAGTVFGLLAAVTLGLL